jgi:transcriptional regulator with XRE-family HTH domain
MPPTRLHLQADRAVARARTGLADDLRRLREDAGISQAQLAKVAGVNQALVSRIEANRVRPALETYGRLFAALGADLHVRTYPNTGPAIRDRHQARIAEGLVAQLHPRWRAHPEAIVRRPARGSIDVVLHDRTAAVALATEIESGLRRIEQLLRWTQDKAESLPSWTGWADLGDPPPLVSRLLVVRRTRATRETARSVARLLHAVYPAPTSLAIEALTASAPWPGPALVWAVIEGARVRLVER